MIVGNSHDGSIPHFQIFYHLIEFIAGRRTWGMLPDLAHHHVDLVPADYVAQAIIWSSLNNVTTVRVLHLCSGPDHALPFRRLRATVLEQFRRHGVSVPTGRTLPMGWFNILRVVTPFAPKRLRRALATLPIFLDYLSEDQPFTNTKLVSYSSQLALSCLKRIRFFVRFLTITLRELTSVSRISSYSEWFRATGTCEDI